MIMRKNIIALVMSLFILLPVAAQERHYTVVISLDGFRWDYTQWYDTPFLDRMAAEGVAAGLVPSFPSKTFPQASTPTTTASWPTSFTTR